MLLGLRMSGRMDSALLSGGERERERERERE
jgi:hypothetical protein